MRNFLAFALFITALGFANRITTHSWGGAVFVYVGEQRAPASVRTVSDYSAIDRQALNRSAHAQLMAYAQTLVRDGNMGIRLGHPLIARQEGGKEFACQISGHNGVYDRMELSFYGTGITVAGEPPMLIVDNDCRATGQLDTLDTVWIPMDAVLATGAKDQELETDGEPPMFIKLQNIPGEWPENWVLYSVRFYRSDNSIMDMTLDAGQLQTASASMLSFNWKVSQ